MALRGCLDLGLVAFADCLVLVFFAIKRVFVDFHTAGSGAYLSASKVAQIADHMLQHRINLFSCDLRVFSQEIVYALVLSEGLKKA